MVEYGLIIGEVCIWCTVNIWFAIWFASVKWLVGSRNFRY